MRDTRNMGNRLRCLVDELYGPTAIENRSSDTTTKRQWLLVTPPDIRIVEKKGYAYIEFEPGKELETLAWLHETSANLRKQYVANHRLQKELLLEQIEKGNSND